MTARNFSGDLQQQGGLSDAGVARQQYEGARHNTTSQYTVYFAGRKRQARQLVSGCFR